MRKICREEKCNNYVWGSGYCVCHQPKKEFPRISKNKLVKSTKEFKESGESSNKMHEFFLSIWAKRPHFSEISPTKYLGKECLSIFMHHILPSRKYPQAAFDEENIIILDMDEHSSVEGDMYKYEEINKRRELLKIKYKL